MGVEGGLLNAEKRNADHTQSADHTGITIIISKRAKINHILNKAIWSMVDCITQTLKSCYDQRLV